VQKRKNKNSVQDLIGIQGFSSYGLQTEQGELIFFSIRPQNISVLSYETVAQKVRQLQQLLSAVPELEFLCTDSCESFEENQRHIKFLLEQEPNPDVRRVLEQDIAHTMLFNILAFMTHQLLGRGNTVAAIDELYIFLTNMTVIEYIRNAMKRVRKKESALVLASQNCEDFLGLYKRSVSKAVQEYLEDIAEEAPKLPRSPREAK